MGALRRRDLASGKSRKHLPGAWPWRRFSKPDDPDAPVFCLIRAHISDPELDTLLKASVEGQGRFVLTTSALDWLMCLYDGGVDICAGAAAERADFEQRHSDWLPPPGT